jgi:hypothetical protein
MSSRKVVIGSLLALGLGACATPNPNARQDGLATKSSVMVLPQSASLYVRASFDGDGASLIGAFFPDDISDAQLDESNAARTRCSQYIKPRKVSAGGNMTEVFGASSGVGGRFGVQGIAQLKGERSNTEALTIKYAATEKLVADVDTTGLAECCRSEPDQCAKRYISQVLAGNGEVYAATERKDEAGLEAEGTMKSIPITGGAFYKDGVKWERKSDFQGQFFAFGLARSRVGELADRIGDDCQRWVSRPPTSVDGQYFVGVSSPAPSEKVARDDAMRAAREQVVKYLGEWLEQASQENRKLGGALNAIEGEMTREENVTALSQGLTRLVKDQAWCGPETEAIPGKGDHKVMRVLVYFPNAERNRAAQLQLTNLMDVLKGKGQLTPEREAAIKQVSASLQ